MMQEKFNFPAARGLQGGRVYYTALVPFGALKRLLAFDTGNVLERSQRDVDPVRAKKVADYIKGNPESWVIPALAGTVNVNPEFAEHLENTQVGTISLPMDAEIKLFDGQHRATGIIAAAAAGNDVLIRTSSVPVQLFVNMSLESRQQAFCDINLNAKTVSKSLSAVYDHRNDASQAIADAVKDKIMVWQVDWQKTACSGKNPNLFPFKVVIDAFRVFLAKGPRDPISKEEAEDAADFFNSLSHVGHWRPAMNYGDSWSNEEGRETYITYHAIGLKALAAWGRQVIEAGENIEDAIQRLEKHAAKMARTNTAWQGKCMDYEERIVSNKDALTATVKYLCLLSDIECRL